MVDDDYILKTECDECGELVFCVELFAKYYCRNCNNKAFDKIDESINKNINNLN